MSKSPSGPFSYFHHFLTPGVIRSVLPGRKIIPKLWNVPAWTFGFLESLEETDTPGFASLEPRRIVWLKRTPTRTHSVCKAGCVCAVGGEGGGSKVSSTTAGTHQARLVPCLCRAGAAVENRASAAGDACPCEGGADGLSRNMNQSFLRFALETTVGVWWIWGLI